MELPQGAYRQQVVEVLRDLVRLDTTNPPGNETAAARYLAQLFQAAGIEAEVVESAPGRGNCIARLRGQGHGKPLMLLGHLDVVSANPSEWRYPPFAAEIHDGFMWGRGTTDMKDMIAICAVAMLALARSGLPMQRDLVLLASADEEHGGRMGVGWLAQQRRELFDVAGVINEGGGGSFQINGHTFYTCQAAEKGLCRVTVTARAAGGHASHPRADIATLKLSQALGHLGDGHLREQTIATMRAALRTIAAAQSAWLAAQVEELLDAGRCDEALRAVGFDGEGWEDARRLFYDTVSVTGLRAGDPQSINVIPAQALAYADGRILPGQTQQGFLDLLRRTMGPEVEVALYERQYSPGLESSTATPVFSLIQETVAERCGGATLIPWQCAGSTDAKHLIPLGVPVYGFVPARPLPEGVQGAGAHADNERLWLENLPFALEMIYDLAARYCTQGQRP